jgi:(E)-4-hydroxy-3-methylbut-2-enyl-diphosphate synthase
VSVDDSNALSRVSDFVTETALLGLEAPLTLAVPLSLAREAADGRPARIALSVGESEPAELHQAIGRVAAKGVPIELCLEGPVKGLPAQVDVAVAAAEATGSQQILLSVSSARATHAARAVAARLAECAARRFPLVLRYQPGAGDPLLDAAVDLGAPLCDGIGDAICLPTAVFGDPGTALDIAYRILQGARLRTTRTEYISCPSCGRTLFDLEQTTARIKRKTEHLKGVKIAVMGCIVNGPGEMADADFGYVGSGVDQVTLYVGKQIVARGLPAESAPDRLVELIQKSGMWHDPAE